MLLPQEIIRRKRHGGTLSGDEIRHFVAGIADQSIGDAQVGAFAMAVCHHAMNDAETVALTLAMRDSGTVLRWDDLPGPVLDKHSTGGIGDKVSLILAPIVAACGGYLPMLSGRGLGHSGGTLDKLESIPGYTVAPDLARLRRAVREAGCAIVSATEDLAPADRRLYAIRDITATVESIPLITASILAKKLAAGPTALVMDVKFGSGAFLPGVADARDLATSIAGVAHGAGLACAALLTDMNQCLGRAAGNAVEVAEAIGVLAGNHADPRLLDVTLTLSAELLVLGGLATDVATGRRMAKEALASGAAAERFARMVVALGGPGDIVEAPDKYLDSAPLTRPLYPSHAGYVEAIDARALGLAILQLGGGRRAPGDTVDASVGLTEVAGLGEPVGPQRPLAILHARDETGAELAANLVRAAFTVGELAFTPPPPVLERVA